MPASSPSRPRLAIVGGGIAGLACAHYLRGAFAIDLYEGAGRLGGHVNAVTTAGAAVPVETGFLAFHRSRYPNLMALFTEFGIETGPSGVGLTVWDRDAGLCYRQSQWFELFGTRLPAELRAQFSSLLGMIFRHEKRPDQVPYPNVSLETFLAERGCHPALARHVLVPSISALWGFQPDEVMAMSTVTVLESLGRFVGQTHDEPFERVVPSTEAWLSKLTGSLDARIFRGVPVSAVTPLAEVVVDGRREGYDAVVLACHADQALRLLTAPTEAQRRILGAIPYNRTVAVLHDDPGVLPPDGRSEYTYTLQAGTAMTTWDMNLIQGLDPVHPWYVTVGVPGWVEQRVAAERIRYRTEYEHPAMTPGAIAALDHLPTLNTAGPLYFCGSYFGVTGSNECAVTSALSVSHHLHHSLPHTPDH